VCYQEVHEGLDTAVYLASSYFGALHLSAARGSLCIAGIVKLVMLADPKISKPPSGCCADGHTVAMG
jgi:hypothetical protein